MRRYAAKIDASQPAIVETLEGFGFSVHKLNGIVDLIAYRPDRGVVLIECKTDIGRRKTVIRHVRSKSAARQAAFAQRFPVVRLTSAHEAERWAQSSLASART